MARKNKKNNNNKKNKSVSKNNGYTLPKDSLSRINMGESFAEYDPLIQDSNIFVSTNAYIAAKDPSRNKCFFIGRRGTGKQR